VAHYTHYIVAHYTVLADALCVIPLTNFWQVLYWSEQVKVICCCITANPIITFYKWFKQTKDQALSTYIDFPELFMTNAR